MRSLCHRLWNWQAKLTKREPHSCMDPRQRTTWSVLVTSDFNSVLVTISSYKKHPFSRLSREIFPRLQPQNTPFPEKMGMRPLYRQLRARRALLQLKDVLLRTRRALLLYKVNGNSALLVLNRTSLICNSALLALSWRYAFEWGRGCLRDSFTVVKAWTRHQFCSIDT